MGTEKKKGFVERSAGFFKRLHYAIGAVALGAAVIFESSTAAVIGALEIAHGALLRILEKHSAKKPGKLQPAPV